MTHVVSDRTPPRRRPADRVLARPFLLPCRVCEVQVRIISIIHYVSISYPYTETHKSSSLVVLVTEMRAFLLSLLLLASILATTSAQEDTSCLGIVTDGVCYTCPGGNFGDAIGGYRPTCAPLSRAPTPSLALRASLVRQATTARAPMGQSARQQRNRILQKAETASARVRAPLEASSPSTSSTMQWPR